jgi:hypothetical protein
MKPHIKINFTDFWSDFIKTNNYFYNLLIKHYDIEITNEPDFLIYSYFGQDFRNYNCIRIFYTGENVKPNFNECDYAFSFDFNKHFGKNYRLPLYALYGDVNLLTRKKDVDAIINKKTKFCNMVVSNEKAQERIKFFKKLSEYKPIDSGGRYMNNIGGPVVNKREFIKDYKFTIAFENSYGKGYTSEKIFEAMLVNSIPIYWGNPQINRDFNTKSFINYYDFKNEDELIERIIAIDNNEQLYREYLEQPYFNNNTVNKYVKEENVIKQFDYIFKHKNKRPIAVSWKRHFQYLDDFKAKLKDKIKYEIKKKL